MRRRVEAFVAALDGEGRLDADSAAKPRTNVIATLSCTAAAEKQVAGSLRPSSGSREHRLGAPVPDESADPAKSLLLHASRWTRPALEGKPSSEKDPSEFVSFSSSLSSSDPPRNHQRCRRRNRAARAGLPQKRSLRRRARRRWRPPGCRFLRAQPQRKRPPNPTPSPSA